MTEFGCGRWTWAGVWLISAGPDAWLALADAAVTRDCRPSDVTRHRGLVTTGHWSCRVRHCRYNDLASASRQTFMAFYFVVDMSFPEDACNIVKSPSFLLIKGSRQSQLSYWKCLFTVIWAW